MVARILLILSVFSFVLAAPVPVQKVRDADYDVVDVDENVIIASRKRAERGNPYKRLDSDSESEWDRSDPEWLTWTPKPSSSSTGSNLQPNPLSTPGETGMPPDPEGALKSGSTTEIQPASSGKVKWEPTTKVIFYDPSHPPDVRLDTAGTANSMQQASSSGTKSISWGHTTKVAFPGEKILAFPPPAQVAKTQSNGLASIFSKLGKLRFWPRL